MKTMNYLFTVVFVLLLSACSNESQNVELELQSTEVKGKKIQEGPVYLELDLHQLALEYKLRELRLKLVQIEEEIESSEGYDSERFQAELERVQRMIDEGRFEHERNSEVISEYRLPRVPRIPRGPGGPGNPCGEEGRCHLDLENATIYVVAREEIDIKKTRNDVACGGLADLAEVPEYEVRVLEAILEGEEGCADEIRFSGVNADGNKFIYSLPLAQ